MKLYLSSYRIGDEQARLLEMLPVGKKIGFIPNAMDHAPGHARIESNAKHTKDLTDLGINVEELDLQIYFGNEKGLREKLEELDGIWVKGGNTFLLRHAMRLSGLDTILKEMKGNDFFYGGFSAGGCVLSPTLKCLQIVDEPEINPYNADGPIWEGLGIIEYAFLPHYRSDHPESKAIEREVEYCMSNNIPFRTLQDGEVLILDY